MSAIFLKILNLSYSASWLILAVIAVRLLLKKAPKWVPCLLWSLVAIRLMVPFSLESALSLLPSSEVVPADIQAENAPHIETGIYVFNSAVNPVMETALAPAEANSVNPMQVVVSVLCIIWITGIFAMALYAFISYAKIKRSVRESILLKKGIRECDEVKSPFILGILRPVIYVPSGMDSATLELVLAHEKAHLKRYDYVWKPLGFVLLSVYWFNPLSWIAYVLLCRDIESACDEKVIRDKSSDYMAAYSQALLDCSIQRRRIAACPVAFGETGVKMRIKNVLSYKKPAFWIIIASLVACVILAVCFLTNPRKDEVSDAVSAGNDQNVTEESGTVFDEERIYYYSGNHFDGTGMEPESLIDFSITFSPDGSYSWYETPISSFIGMGTYSIEGGVLTMTDDAEMTGTKRVNMFIVSGDKLYYSSEGSDNFLFVQLDDKAEFVLGVNPVEGWYEDTTEIESHEFAWPTDKDVVTSGFSTDEEHYHPEVDIAGEKGDPIYAATDGTITETGFNDNDGNYITETSGLITVTYCHLDEISVNVNDVVGAGEIIGTLGSTGRSTGPHLAIRILIGDEPYDFLQLFESYISHELPDNKTEGYEYDYYSEDGSVYLRQDYRTGKSVIVDGDLEIPVDIAMGAYGPKIEKFDADGDGTDEYLIAECEGTGTGISQYGLCIVDKDGDQYKLTRYDSSYFSDYIDENVTCYWDNIRQEFSVYEIRPAYVSSWFGIHVKPFERRCEPEDIVWSDIVDVEFEDGQIYVSAASGYVYSDSPVPDYENAVRVRLKITVLEDSSIQRGGIYDFSMDDGEK